MNVILFVMDFFSEKLIDIMLSSKNFKVLSISIDNRKNTIRKLANVNEKNGMKNGHMLKI